MDQLIHARHDASINGDIIPSEIAPLTCTNPQAEMHQTWPSATDTEAAPSVAILMCTYHGKHYLADQLDSIAQQSHSNWKVFVSDDGSEDETHHLLKQYKSKWPAKRLSIYSGPAKGFAANFLSLICNPDTKADFYAFADQDDIWEQDKLERALKWLRAVPAETPAVYCSRTRLVDSENREIGLSPLFAKKPSFQNALVQSIAGGNTMVFNNAARNLLRTAGPDVSVITHDWWMYLVVTGCGGEVHYDPHPSIRYRQHTGNLVGMNNSWNARLKRIHMLIRGHFQDWNDRNVAALLRINEKLTPENIKIFQNFLKARQSSLVPRLYYFKRSGIYRQTLFGTVGLIMAAIFAKL